MHEFCVGQIRGTTTFTLHVATSCLV